MSGIGWQREQVGTALLKIVCVGCFIDLCPARTGFCSISNFILNSEEALFLGVVWVEIDF